jgi:hypothetical protein
MTIRALVALGLAAVTVINAGALCARDLGQWGNTDPDRAAWFKAQKQPDHEGEDSVPGCCGVGDAYYADDYETKDGRFYAIITDTRPDEPLKRAHIVPGTRIEIPQHKFNDTRLHGINPTGHGIVFLGIMSTYTIVYCYFSPGGA